MREESFTESYIQELQVCKKMDGKDPLIMYPCPSLIRLSYQDYTTNSQQSLQNLDNPFFYFTNVCRGAAENMFLKLVGIKITMVISNKMVRNNDACWA